MNFKSSLRRLASMAALAVTAVMAGCSFVPTGSVGVVSNVKTVDPVELPAGWHLTWFSSVKDHTIQDVVHTFENVPAKAKGGVAAQDFDVDIYVRANPALVAETTTKYLGQTVLHSDVQKSGGSDQYIAGYHRFQRQARATLQTALSNYDPTSLIGKEVAIAADIQKALQAELDKEDKGIWEVTGVDVRNLTMDPKLAASAKEVADLDLQIQKQVKQEQLEQAKGKVAKAKAEAEAQANVILSSSLTPQLMRKLELETQAKFAGQGTHTVVMGGSASPLLNVGK